MLMFKLSSSYQRISSPPPLSLAGRPDLAASPYASSDLAELVGKGSQVSSNYQLNCNNFLQVVYKVDQISMVVFKNRYMVMEVFIDSNKNASGNDPIIISQFNISKAIKDSILLNFGECGLAISLGSFQVKYVNPITKLCIIRASREDHQKVWSAITMVRSIGNCPVMFNLLDLSGSIRACKNATLKCDEAKFEQYKLASGDRVTPETINLVQSCFEKIGTLEN